MGVGALGVEGAEVAFPEGVGGTSPLGVPTNEANRTTLEGVAAEAPEGVGLEDGAGSSLG